MASGPRPAAHAGQAPGSDRLLGALAPLAHKNALIPYAIVISVSVMVSHNLTYMLMSSGPGYESNPPAFMTIWMSPMLNLALWQGAIFRLMVAEWVCFERNEDLIIPFTLGLTVLCAFDAINDIIMSIQAGLLRGRAF